MMGVRDTRRTRRVLLVLLVAALALIAFGYQDGSSQRLLWDDRGNQMWNCRYAKNFWHLPIPAQPLSDIELANGLRYRCIAPLRGYALTHDSYYIDEYLTASSSFDARIASIRVSVGTGVSWASPFGPIRLDFGIPVKKESFNKNEIFRVSPIAAHKTG